MANSKGWLSNKDVMGPLMEAGMVFVIVGVIGSAVFMLLMKSRVVRSHRARVIFTPAYLELLHNAPWTRAHLYLMITLTFAVAIDVMKPATIGFIMPGLLLEYKLTKVQGAGLHPAHHCHLGHRRGLAAVGLHGRPHRAPILSSPVHHSLHRHEHLRRHALLPHQHFAPRR